MRPISLAVALAAVSCRGEPGPAAATPEGRAVEFLAREVRQWPVRNKCFSCHNNGDAARALYAARRLSLPFDGSALNATNEWLLRPDDWKYNGPPGEFNDKKLAAIQFAYALSAAAETGALDPGPALFRAAEIVRAEQDADGSWTVDAGGLPGSPATYGRALATVAARRVLAAASPGRFADAIGRADAWLLRQRPKGVLDAAAVLIGLAPLDGADARRREALELIRAGQTREGGWGPYVTSPPEVFDTAVVLLALATVRDPGGDMIRRGREFLVGSQHPDGSWTETTRPAGVESYAQRISTGGWATLALLATR